MRRDRFLPFLAGMGHRICGVVSSSAMVANTDSVNEGSQLKLVVAQTCARCCPGHHSNRVRTPLLHCTPETRGSIQRLGIVIWGQGAPPHPPALGEAPTLR